MKLDISKKHRHAVLGLAMGRGGEGGPVACVVDKAAHAHMLVHS